MLATRTRQSPQPSALRPVVARSQTVRRLATGARSDRRRPDGAAQAAEALSTAGQPLDARARTELEPQFGYDFSSVRVHTDDGAARASRAIGAVAYTAGTDIAFDTGRYAPHSPAGRALLAHELTHVAQQSHASLDSAPSIAPTGGAAEHEADHAAAVVSGGGQLAGPVSPAGGAIQRSVGGIIGGVAGGLVGGALLGAAIEILARGSRALTDHEQAEAKKVFGDSLNYGQVRVAESTVMTLPGKYARTPGNTIYLPPGTLKKAAEHEKGTSPDDKNEYNWYLHWLIHEMTHTWQTQHGVSMWTKLKTALKGASIYNYDGPDGLKKASAAGKHFVDFNTEQQADICADYYAIREGFKSGDKSIYEPFIQEVRRGGLPEAPKPEFNDGVMPAKGPTMMA
jgi:hypothetical protein